MITGMPRIAVAVNDFAEVVAAFRQQFGMPVDDLSATSALSLGAELAMCVPPGGSNIELMSPAVEEAPLAKSLRRFLTRRGEGLFALMLEADDPNAEANRLLGNGINVLPLMEGAGGRDVHPNSTHGVLIRIYPTGSYANRLSETDLSIGLSGIVRVQVGVRDLDAAVDVYGTRLGLPVDPIVVDETRGVRSAVCHPPSGGTIELISVQNPSRAFSARLREFLASRGEGMYALVLQARDPESARAALTHRGVALQADDLIATVAGARIRIERGPN